MIFEWKATVFAANAIFFLFQKSAEFNKNLYNLTYLQPIAPYQHLHIQLSGFLEKNNILLPLLEKAWNL